LDQAQTAYFLDRYARMSDEELSYLLVTRGDSLSEEASHALHTVLGGRDPTLLRQEVQATTADLHAQIERAEHEARKQQKAARLQHNGIRIVCAVLLIVGLIAWMSGHANEGIGFAIGGIALFLLIEIRRLVWRFIAALFDPNAR
jgi:ABC-type transport system involved in cytochrome bd biosynthesis fused ATPase/permease subunit